MTSIEQRELFYNRILANTKHDIELRALPSTKRLFTRDIKKIENFVSENIRQNLYHGVYTREGGGKKENAREVNCFFADPDFKDYERGEAEARERLKKFEFHPTYVIHSGNGFQAYWFLDRIIEPSHRIEAILRGIAKTLGADTSVAELARVLRIPGTFNYKNIPRKTVSIIYSSDRVYSPELFDKYEDKTILPETRNNGNQELSTHIEEIKTKCVFLKYCYENKENLPEPLWFQMVSNLTRYNTRPFDLVHAYSQGFPGYSPRETEHKIKHCLNDAGPHTCKAIKQTMKDCIGHDCGKDCGVKSPIVKLNSQPTEQKQPTQTEILLGIALSTLQLFHDQNREPFCYFQNQTLPLKSNKVKESLGYQFYAQTGKAPNSDALNQAINVLKGKALFECPRIELYNRVAVADNAVWYDMGDGTAIRTTAGIWEHTGKVPPLFRHYSHQKAQAKPFSSGDPWRVFNYLNIDKDHQLLVLVYIVSCFIPSIPHPIFHPHGPQGSGKTTFCQVLKELIDPSSLSTLIMQRDYAQLIQAIAHHHFVPFDNLSDLPAWASDILAIACTGGGLSKRQLYTDDDDIVLSVRRCIGINAINLLISKPDLMDRTILLHLERITPSKRRDETEFWDDFEKQKAGILGGIFDTLARAIQLYPSVKLERLPRMADFAKWGYSIGDTLQQKGGNAFLEAYQNNIKRQNEEIIQSNTLILAILKEMHQKTEWVGTIKTIYSKLLEIANPHKNDPSFPKTERSLRKHLERAKTTLIQQGINFIIGKRTAEGIPITITKSDFQEDTEESTFASSSTQNESVSVANEDNVNNFGSSRNDLTELIDLTGENFEVIE